MVSFSVYLMDITDNSTSGWVTIPLDGKYNILEDHEYMITDTDSGLQIGENENIYILNENIKKINHKRKDMSLEFLSLLSTAYDASPTPLSDDEFISQVAEEKFFFDDITNVDWFLPDREKAARYLATVISVPFNPAIDPDTIQPDLYDYIDWDGIWETYGQMGFELIRETDKNMKMHKYIIGFGV